MIVVTVFLSILNQMEIHLVQNRNENCHHDHIPINLKGYGILVFSVQNNQKMNSERITGQPIQSFGLQTPGYCTTVDSQECAPLLLPKGHNPPGQHPLGYSRLNISHPYIPILYIPLMDIPHLDNIHLDILAWTFPICTFPSWTFPIWTTTTWTTPSGHAYTLDTCHPNVFPERYPL